MRRTSAFAIVLFAITSLVCACGGVSAPESWSGGPAQMSNGGDIGSSSRANMPSRFLTVVNHLDEPVEVYVNGMLEATISPTRFASTYVDDVEGPSLQVVVKGMDSGTIYSKELQRANKFQALHIGNP